MSSFGIFWLFKTHCGLLDLTELLGGVRNHLLTKWQYDLRYCIWQLWNYKAKKSNNKNNKTQTNYKKQMRLQSKAEEKAFFFLNETKYCINGGNDAQELCLAS